MPEGEKKEHSAWVGKAVLLATLSVQHALVGFLVRQSRTSADGAKFLPQTGVLMQEVVKVVSSFALAAITGEALGKIFSDPRELLRSSVPALLYLVQNNLQYVALKYLDPATYTVTYQLKILSAAIMSVILLGRSLGLQKWVALCMLVAGVSIVQLATMDSDSLAQRGSSRSQQFLGLMAVLASCASSGLAGVYTERILKSSSVSLWVRNVQLATLSLLVGGLGLFLTGDMEPVLSGGFFQGYNGWVCASILNNSFGGLLIAVIIKYADNIIKNFATAVSIVLSTAATSYMLGVSFTLQFFVGVGIVSLSTFLYSGALDAYTQRFKVLVTKE
eukprot:TRINITY_DN94879_c0_g1_i1.p1 TRINITY_DN94879_c0_g1~~TRINITY_DN94879_c0_g1_i1.p1  ORF type:complete len:332 (+),score=34.01 TRINITY_DN94879_c0_g1_i1:74-1069(+)